MKLVHEVCRLHLGTPFATEKGVVASFEQIFVRLCWDGLVGIGAAVLAKEYGMTAEGVAAALQTCSEVLDEADDPAEIGFIHSRLVAVASTHPSAVAAVDMALHDLLGQAAGKPLRALWGLDQESLPPTAISLGHMPLKELLGSAVRLSAWPVLKLKMKSDSDPGVVGKVREIYSGRIWVDGNSAWTFDRALEVSLELKRYGVELLEQPIRPGERLALRELRKCGGVKLVADEDCVKIEDIPRLQGCVDVVNIKLFRCGGIHPARQMIRVARAYGLKIMLGCKTESAVGITATGHLAGLADYLDLDGHLDVIDDPFSGMKVEFGAIKIPEGNGLGLSVQRERSG
jgi:L-alanine-DL-glutamate epimerase-like enolase superfamily enzyme